MSLHAQLSPDAARALRKQKRNSTITSLLIALLTIFLVAISLTLVFIKGLQLNEKKGIVVEPYTLRKAAPDRPKTPTSITRKPNRPSRAMTRSIVAQTASLISLPTPEVTSPIPSQDFGSGLDVGSGWDTGPDNTYGTIPASFRKRCSRADRLQRLAAHGGNEACEDAVLKSLHWLQDNQNSDGSWGSQKPVAMTSLALLAYLGHCETPASLEFGDAVTDGLLYLLGNNLRQNGRCASDLKDKHWCYEHAIATYALAESFLMCRACGLEALTPQIQEAVSSSTQWILDNQTKAGGWDYAYASDGRPGDTSIVAWHLQALKAVNSTGIRFPRLKRTISHGLSFLAECQNENGGFGYGLNKKPVGSANGHFTLTGAGVLYFQQHKGTQNSQARAGMRYLNKNLRFDYPAGESNLYEHYYAGQAAINQGGREWQQYNGLVRNQLLQNQKPDGSWPRSTGPGNHSHPVYATALATLMLEVYYRYLPGTSSANGGRFE